MKTVAELLRTRVDENPDGLACTFTKAGERTSLTYAELWTDVMATAGTITALTRPQDRCVLAMPSSLDFVSTLFAVAVAGRVAVPLPEIGALNAQASERIERVVADCSPTLLVTGEAESALSLRSRPDLTAGATVLDKVEPGDPTLAQGDGLDPGSLFILQYTSGSIGHPKGVRVTHENVLHNSATIGSAWGLSTSWSGLTWLPLFHDMGLLGGLMVPLRMGFPSHLLPTSDMLRHPLNWLRMFSELGPTASGSPDFGYRKCIERVREEDVATLDLSRWDIAFSGSEPISSATMEAFARHFAPAGFRASAMLACYGLAENTVFVTGSEPSQGLTSTTFVADALEGHGRLVVAGDEQTRTTRLVGNGSVTGAIGVTILDASGAPVADGQIGEVAVLETPSAAGGYWNGASIVANGVLRTGDLGAVHEGNLYITGRSKDLMIFSGRNVYPGDVEHAVQVLSPSFESGYGAVFSVDDPDGRERGAVVVQAVRNRQERTKEAAQRIAQEVSHQFGITVLDVVLVARADVPRTTSGKVQRSAAKRRYQAGGYENGQRLLETVQAPLAPPAPVAAVDRTDEGAVLAAILAGVNRLAKTGQTPDPHTPFAELGLDSVDVVQLVAELGDATHEELDAVQVYDHPTPEALASHIAQRSRSTQTEHDEDLALLMKELRDELREG